MTKIPNEKDALTFSRQVNVRVTDGKQVMPTAMFEGVEVRGFQKGISTSGLSAPGAGKQMPVNALPSNFTSPKSPKIPSKK